MVFCAALNCLNYSKLKVSTFKFPANSKLRKQWLLKMKRKEFQPGKNSRICAIHFTEDYIRENLAIRRFLGSDFKSLRLHLKRMLCRGLFFFVRKRNHGEECLPKHKDPTVRSAFAKRRKLRGMHFALFLFYLELHRVFVMIISTFTLLVWLVTIRH